VTDVSHREFPQPEGVALLPAPYSHVVVSGSLVFVSGQVSIDENGAVVGSEIRAQTRQTLENLQRCLSAAGCTLAHALKVNVFLADLGDYEGFNEVYAEIFEPPYPARRTVLAGLGPGFLVEIDAIAQRP
jgi:2-iminobutanoate/2-iminopropanoate deaminase